MAVASTVPSSPLQWEEAGAVPIPCPAAFDLRDWLELPAIVDAIASPDTRLALDNSVRVEAIARRHPEWLDPYEATLVCAAGVLRHDPSGLHLLKTVLSLNLSPARRMQAENIAVDQRVEQSLR